MFLSSLHYGLEGWVVLRKRGVGRASYAVLAKREAGAGNGLPGASPLLSTWRACGTCRAGGRKGRVPLPLWAGVSPCRWGGQGVRFGLSSGFAPGAVAEYSEPGFGGDGMGRTAACLRGGCCCGGKFGLGPWLR